MSIRFGLLFSLLALAPVSTHAQSDSSIYKGLRISLFDFSIRKQKGKNITVQLSVANTGRLPVDFGKKNKPAPDELIVELDTVSLPLALQGREQVLTEAVRQNKLTLAPGEILRDLALDIQFHTVAHGKTPPPSGIDGPACADLVFDTVIILQYTENSMSLRYTIRNIGNAAANLLGQNDDAGDNLAVNAYFVSGTKLTRGAILANGVFIEPGRETIDGVLLPGQALEGKIEISLNSRTRYTPNLVFELNPFQTVKECDRTNNTQALVVEF